MPYQQHPQQPPGANVVQNPPSPTVPQVKGPEMNDRDYINDVLATEKHLTDNYNVFAREASHRALHNDVMNILIETHQMSRELFNLMFKKGFYKLEMEDGQKLHQTHQQFANYQTQFPYGPPQGFGHPGQGGM